jgi:hypothetical protein
MRDKVGPSVRNDGLRHTIHTQDASNIQLSILLSRVEGVHRNEMSRLGKSVDDYPDGVKLEGSERQTHNKIHADVFPFLGRNTQMLQQSERSDMIGLHSSTHFTF